MHLSKRNKNNKHNKMKNIIFILSLLLVGFSLQAQEEIKVKKNKNARIAFEVDGICGMCKQRIEKAALKTKGVKFAIWSVENHQLNVIMDERKTDIETLQKSILDVGHDIIVSENETKKATEMAYNTVHPCCKYRDEEIIKDHKGELKKVKKQ